MLEKIHGCFRTTKVRIGDNEVSFKRPFKRISMIDSIKEHRNRYFGDGYLKHFLTLAKN